MRGRRFIATLAMALFGAVLGMRASWGQQAAAPPNGGAPGAKGGAGGATSPDATQKPAKVGSYSLVVTTLEPTLATHWLNPAPTISVKGGTKYAPAETAGNVTAPPQYTIEAFGVPQQECKEAAEQPHGCDALDRTDLTIRDLNTVEYRFTSHGGAVEIQVNLQVHDLLPVAHGNASTDRHTGDVIFVSVPKATPVYRFISETLVGEWKGEPMVFEAGKPLPDGAKKGLEELAVHQDLGDAVLYSYQVK
jgi:hypothetical protein